MNIIRSGRLKNLSLNTFSFEQKETHLVASGPTEFSAKQKTACRFCLNPDLTAT